MSESRQRFTGRIFGVGVGFILLWLLFATLPLLTRYIQVYSMDPRFMTPEDLTWKRLLFNVLSKPGMRWLLLTVFGGVGMVISWLARGKGGRVARPKPRVLFEVPISMEWVIDGPKKNSLIEYGCFVEAI